MGRPAEGASRTLVSAGIPQPWVQLVPVTEDARRMWAAWVVDRGGEGIVLKHWRAS